jgi:hypothetical protein
VSRHLYLCHGRAWPGHDTLVNARRSISSHGESTPAQCGRTERVAQVGTPENPTKPIIEVKSAAI